MSIQKSESIKDLLKNSEERLLEFAKTTNMRFQELEKGLNLPKETLSQKVKPKTLSQKVKSFFSKIFRN